MVALSAPTLYSLKLFTENTLLAYSATLKNRTHNYILLLVIELINPTTRDERDMQASSGKIGHFDDDLMMKKLMILLKRDVVFSN